MKMYEVFKKMMIATALTLAFVGCDGNGGGSDPVYGYGIGSCQGCEQIASSPVQLATVTATETLQKVQLQLQIIGSGHLLMNQSTPYNSASGSYYGPVVAQGFMSVQTPLNDQMGACVIPPGQYQVNSLMAGTLGTPAGGNLALPDLIINPGNIRAQVIQGIMYSGGTKLMGILRIVSQNGRGCAPNFTGNLF